MWNEKRNIWNRIREIERAEKMELDQIDRLLRDMQEVLKTSQDQDPDLFFLAGLHYLWQDILGLRQRIALVRTTQERRHALLMELKHLLKDCGNSNACRSEAKIT